MDQITLIALLCCIFLVAGTIKGAVGIGLPTAAIGMMTLFIDPRTAISYFILPMLLINFWQAYRQGQIVAAFWRYLPFGITLIVFVALTVAVSQNAPDRVLMGVLGVVIVSFVIMNFADLSPRIAASYDRTAQIIAGGVSGVLGGLVGIWAPPMVAYLTARGTNKEEFVRASGLLIVLGSIPLTLGYLSSGQLTASTAAVSLALIPPTFIGFALGEKLRGHLSEAAFKHLLMGVFFIMGLNLLRRAVFG